MNSYLCDKCGKTVVTMHGATVYHDCPKRKNPTRSERKLLDKLTEQEEDKE
jgi:hypothetical protein